MSPYSLSHVGNYVLVRDLDALVTQDRGTTAAMLAHLAEVEARRLYAPAGYSSMSRYCVGRLRMPEEVAYKRLQAARAARQFPAIFAAVADGRLHFTAVVKLKPYLTPETADGLLAAAANKTIEEIERLLAERFPQPDVPTFVRPVMPARERSDTGRACSAPGGEAAAETSGDSAEVTSVLEQLDSNPVAHANAGRDETPVEPPPRYPKLAPLSPERFALQVTVSKETHDKLRRAQSLLGHAVPGSDLALVLDRAFDALIHQLERRKFAATDRPGKRRRTASARHVPAHVKRTVHARDRGRCTFVSDHGHRCEATSDLEFDHIVPVARGGQTSVDNLRLRCRAHNQLEAERTFGAGFMQAKREEAAARA